MSHHRDACHGSFTEFIILEGHLIIVFLEKRDRSFKVTDAIKISLDSLFNF